jgi:hypothetical protein
MQFSPEAFSTYTVCGGFGSVRSVGVAFFAGVQLPSIAYIRSPTCDTM